MAKASQVVIMEGEYYIIKAPNGKVLEVKDFNTENGAGIQLWSYAGHPWQQWQFVDAGEGRWRIQNRFTGGGYMAAPVEPHQRAEPVLGTGAYPQRAHPHPQCAGG